MKPKNHTTRRSFPRTLAVCVAPLLACANADARVLFANESNSSRTWTFPSGTNLLTDPASLGVVTHEGSDSTWHTVIDGSLGDLNGGPATSCTPNNGTVVTFPLDLTGHPGGRDITSFDSYCSWGNSGRDNQDYTLQYETVANPGVFITIAAVSVRTSSHSGTHTRLTDTNGILAPGAKSLRVIFSGGQENGYVGYREFIALDAPVVVAVSNEKNNNNIWPLPSGNLLTTTSSSAPTGNEGSSTNWNVLIDGSVGDFNEHAATAVAPSNGQSVVFPLDLTDHPAGRDITTIDSYSAWGSDGRDDSHYTLEYDTVASPGVFLPITAVANTSEFTSGANRATHSSVRTNTGAPLALGVNSIRITFNGQENGYEGFREFVVRDTPYTTILVNEANDTGSWTLPAGANLIGTGTTTTVGTSPPSVHGGDVASTTWDTARDGLLGDGQPGTSCTPNNNDEVTFVLDTSTNVFGYNLTSFDSYCAWANSGRDDQDYTLSYSVVGAEGVFIPIGVVRNHTLETKATHSRIAAVSGVLATNVSEIRLKFAYNQENGFTGFREFVALGSAVPLDAPITWTGTTDGSWDTTTNNWSGPYNTAAPLTFAETGINRTINVPTAITAASLSFTNTSSPFTIGGSAVTVTNDISSTGSGLATFNSSMSAATGVSLSGSGSLVFNADVTAPGITLTGTGGITLNAANPTLTGSVSVSNGLLSVTNNDALATTNLSMTGGTAAFTTSAPTVLSIAGPAGSIVLGDSTGPVSTVLSVGDISTVSTSFAGDISNAAGATSGLTKTGESSLTLSGDNTYTGVTNVTGGTLEFGKRLSLYHGTTGSWTAGNILVSDTATVGLAVGGGGEFTESDINSLALGGFAPGSSLGVNASADVTLSQNLPTGVGLTKTGTSVLTLTGANGSSGLVKIISGTVNANSSTHAFGGNVLMTGGLAVSSLNMGGNDQFSPGSVLTFSNGNFYQVKVNLRGTSQTLAGLDAAGFPTNKITIIQNDEVGQPGYTVNPGTASLTLDTATDHSFLGIIRNQDGGALSLIKNGTGTQELRNQSGIADYGYTGDTTINGGTLKLSFTGGNAGFASNVVLGSLGTLAFNAVGTDNNFGKLISGTGKITVTGTSVVRLTNRFNSFSGGITVGSPEVDSNNGFLALVAQGGAQGAGNGLGQVCVGGAMDPDNVITVNGGATLALDGIAPLGESTMMPQYAPSVVINNSRIYGQNVVFVPNLTLNHGDVQIREGAPTGGYNTNLAFVGTVVVGGDSILPSIIHVTNPGTYSNASLGSNGLPGTTFQVADVTGDNVVDLTVDVPLQNVGGIVSPLTKTGPGTMLLSGTNTYTGDTTVSGGELTLSGTSIANPNKLVIDGGKVGVVAAANETVKTLFFGAVQQDAGTYGSTASGATHQDDTRFSGTGILTVTNGPLVTYEDWAAVITNGENLRTDDADGDGVDNLQEFLFGTSPISGEGSLTTTENTGSGLIVRWCERLGSGSTYVLQESTDLDIWNTSGVVPTVDANQDALYSDSYVRKQAVIPITGGSKFARVQATE